ncbi:MULTISPECIES: hypothetical protein [unclassified Nonomuraea]
MREHDVTWFEEPVSSGDLARPRPDAPGHGLELRAAAAEPHRVS